MKKYLESMYAYDHAASTKMMDLLADLPNEVLEADRKSHYKSLKGLTLHTVQGHMFFNNMFKTQLGDVAAVLKHYDNTQELTYESCLSHLEEMYSSMSAFIAQLTLEQLEADMDFFGQSKTVMSMLLILFNHSVHHRGQVSQVLDELGIEHDWAMLYKG
jgi:uncharacterized damage-inducible protein DinB